MFREIIIINIPTAYEEKYEKVEKVLKEVLEKAKETYPEITEVEYLGINNFNDSSIDYLIKITCHRETHWNIKRQVLKEIKLAYDIKHSLDLKLVFLQNQKLHHLMLKLYLYPYILYLSGVF